MKGLLYKDFIYLKKYFFSVGSILAMTIFTVICVTFFTCAVNGHTVENAYSSMYFMVLGIILIFVTANSLSTSLFVLDEKPANINFLFSTPSAAKGHIQSKYYSLLIIQLGILLICFLVDIVRMLMIREYAISSSLFCMILFCISLILLAIRIPFIIRYGSGISTTVRSAYIIAIIAFILLSAGSLKPLQTISIAASLPFLFIIFAIILAMIKELKKENSAFRKMLDRAASL